MSTTGLVRRVWNRALVEADLFAWRKSTASIRSIPCPPLHKVALFCDLMAMYSIAKVEALFAAAFAQRTYRSVVLLPERSALISSVVNLSREFFLLTMTAIPS